MVAVVEAVQLRQHYPDRQQGRPPRTPRPATVSRPRRTATAASTARSPPRRASAAGVRRSPGAGAAPRRLAEPRDLARSRRARAAATGARSSSFRWSPARKWYRIPPHRVSLHGSVLTRRTRSGAHTRPTGSRSSAERGLSARARANSRRAAATSPSLTASRAATSRSRQSELVALDRAPQCRAAPAPSCPSSSRTSAELQPRRRRPRLDRLGGAGAVERLAELAARRRALARVDLLRGEERDRLRADARARRARHERHASAERQPRARGSAVRRGRGRPGEQAEREQRQRRDRRSCQIQSIAAPSTNPSTTASSAADGRAVVVGTPAQPRRARRRGRPRTPPRSAAGRSRPAPPASRARASARSARTSRASPCCAHQGSKPPAPSPAERVLAATGRAAALQNCQRPLPPPLERCSST